MWINESFLDFIIQLFEIYVDIIKYTWAPQTVHNTPVMNILKGYFYWILF